MAGRLCDNGVGVLFTDDKTGTIVTVTYKGAVLNQFKSTKGVLDDEARQRVIAHLSTSGVSYFDEDNIGAVGVVRDATSKLVGALQALGVPL